VGNQQIMRVQNLFNNPLMYKFFQTLISRKSTLEMIEIEIINAPDSTSVLDFGCGLGHHSKSFNNQIYLGIEPTESCIQVANRFYARQNVQFRVGDHKTLAEYQDASFDLVLAMGVIHHMNDNDYKEFITEANRLLKPGGRLVTLDPVLHDSQRRISKWVVSKDRGEWVRGQSDYLTTLKNSFSDIDTKIFSGLLRLPYDHISVTARKSMT
jgi:ubiquinone/menaquinone biosynthesis C-methylase UbiE